MRRWWSVGGICLVLAGCGDAYERQRSWIEWFFELGRTGDGQDYYLVKSSMFGPDRVAVIYGFMNDGEFCNEIAFLYMQRYPADRYYCEPAN